MSEFWTPNKLFSLLAIPAGAVALSGCGGGGSQVGGFNLLDCKKGPKHNIVSLNRLPKNKKIELEEGDIEITSDGKGLFTVDLNSNDSFASTQGNGYVDYHNDSNDVEIWATEPPNAPEQIEAQEGDHIYDIAGLPGPSDTTHLTITASCNPLDNNH